MTATQRDEDRGQRPYVVRWDVVRGRVWWQHRHGQIPTPFGWFAATASDRTHRATSPTSSTTGHPMLLLVAYLAAILGANLAVTHLDPVPVGFGLLAPAGVYFIALILVLRDLVQERYGVRGALLALAAGSVLSFALADPFVALASVLAFAAAGLVDTVVFSVVRRRVALWAAVLISGVIAAVPDSIVFLRVAFGPEGDAFLPGQLVGKIGGTLAAAVVIYLVRRQRRVAVA